MSISQATHYCLCTWNNKLVIVLLVLTQYLCQSALAVGYIMLLDYRALLLAGLPCCNTAAKPPGARQRDQRRSQLCVAAVFWTSDRCK